jgi:hypothetical protein
LIAGSSSLCSCTPPALLCPPPPVCPPVYYCPPPPVCAPVYSYCPPAPCVSFVRQPLLARLRTCRLFGRCW